MTLRDLGRSTVTAVASKVGRAASKVQESRPIPSDLLESEDAYLIVFDAAGATGSDVQVRFVRDSVLVRIDRFRDFHEGFDMVFPGRGMSLDGQVELPADAEVDPKKATATLTDSGTLQVTVPKAE
ncbi:putative Hsp20 [Haladaptatus paucihalophilus DX253]|uniref:Molecular chaperone IbpA, HSP20 family n=1 Tax=Haladaptatus paucihalophilus DX253 TaxID=797209 RepID=E7QWY2_HALPU|nr:MULTISPECIES: Hsp20/alpha crystallin family protein [Haladaptatus]EFW90785.1 putative Hsp20 [Haladaptatus paucihalophilus DX253]GKZ15699.1 heat-shock protein Hsp20 [Haladaptatus sp. T7]SHK22245.1 Molecular chaperone IbpA, HSP20 family [Haladaptatus paucihalophilus DX253]